MGSFASTCAVSGLPLEVGTKVRFLLLCENPYKDSAKCNFCDIWFPRTYPLKGVYNDYGSVEDYTLGFQMGNWMEGFSYDLAEIGTGDNRCHDVPLLKEMSFAHLLDALGEDRVFVTRNSPFTDHSFYTQKLEEQLDKLAKLRDQMEGFLKEAGVEVPPPVESPPPLQKEIPTLQNLMEFFKASGLPLYDKGPEGYLIDEERYGSMRVRWSTSYGDSLIRLEYAQHLLEKDYAAMLTCGTGNYPSTEIVVRPRYDVKDKNGHPISVPHINKEEPLSIALAMIREDVWQALVKIGKTLEPSYDTDHKTDLMEVVRRAWSNKDRGGINRGNHVIGTVGVGSHWYLMIEKADKIPKKERDDFLKTVGEFHYVEKVLSYTRYWWRPSYSIGPQFGEFEIHERVLSSFASIAKTVADKNQEEQ